MLLLFVLFILLHGVLHIHIEYWNLALIIYPIVITSIYFRVLVNHCLSHGLNYNGTMFFVRVVLGTKTYYGS